VTPASMLSQATHVDLGSPIVRPGIRSSMGPFQTFDPVAVYPDVVVRALVRLYFEYDSAFAPLMKANAEFDSDYRYCRDPHNFSVQIDMAGLSADVLDELSRMRVEEVVEVLRTRIFEIDNSIAMYQLLCRIFGRDDQQSRFETAWRAALRDLRSRHALPIALLAVTDDKYDAMLTTEFGLERGSHVGDEDVRRLSGFDRFFSPAGFAEYVNDNDGRCGYLLYVRASEPVTRLRKPGLEITHPLLADASLRRLIREHTLTINIDNPEEDDSTRKINDTKRYMAQMGLAYPISSFDDFSDRAFAEFMAGRGVDIDSINSGEVLLRAKPDGGTYGAYGHVRGPLPSASFRSHLKRELRMRGGYVVQPDIPATCAVNTASDEMYHYIDRLFIGWRAGRPTWLGGFRNFMPANTTEAQQGRIHGNGAAVWQEIIPA
jgi:hypothetical protein